MAKAHPLSFRYDVILITRRRHISNISDLIFIVVLYVLLISRPAT